MSESQPILSGTELKTLIGEVEVAYHRLVMAHTDSKQDEKVHRHRAARLALEEYVAGIQESEALRLREIAAASRSLYDQNQEIQRLRSSALTETEAKALREWLRNSVLPDDSPDRKEPVANFIAGRAKLDQIISSLRSTYSRELVK